jgi:hypothetical protein
MGRPVAASHRRTALSCQAPVRIVRPSGLKAMAERVTQAKSTGRPRRRPDATSRCWT